MTQVCSDLPENWEQTCTTISLPRPWAKRVTNLGILINQGVTSLVTPQHVFPSLRWKCSLPNKMRKRPIVLLQSFTVIGHISYLILAFRNTALLHIIAILIHINPRCKQLLDHHLTSYYLYFPNPNIHEMLNFVRVWSGSGITQEGQALFWTLACLVVNQLCKLVQPKCNVLNSLDVLIHECNLACKQ